MKCPCEWKCYLPVKAWFRCYSCTIWKDSLMIHPICAQIGSPRWQHTRAHPIYRQQRRMSRETSVWPIGLLFPGNHEENWFYLSYIKSVSKQAHLLRASRLSKPARNLCSLVSYHQKYPPSLQTLIYSPVRSFASSKVFPSLCFQ